MTKSSEAAIVEAFLQGRSELHDHDSGSPVPGSLLFAPPFQYFPEQGTSGRSPTTEATVSNSAEPPSRGSDFNRSRKRTRTDDSPGPEFGKRTTPLLISENLAHGKGEPLTP